MAYARQYTVVETSAIPIAEEQIYKDANGSLITITDAMTGTADFLQGIF
ncbi:hypothetical protein [Domibacillus robiginosus]|nr:hypothetical protein [Domibacillus robiginosus]